MKRFLYITFAVFALLVSNRAFADGFVSGFVLEQDSISPIEAATVHFWGIGSEGDTLSYQFFSDSFGHYEAQLEAGRYQVFASAEGYSTSFLPDSLWIGTDSAFYAIDFILIELMSLKFVSGHVLEQDGVSPIESATISFSGFSEAGDTLFLQVFADAYGYYETQLERGVYQVFASAEGYSPSVLADSLRIETNSLSYVIDFILNELYYPVQYVTAQVFADDFVRVSWLSHGTESDGRAFHSFELFRRRFGEEPVLMASLASDTVFVDVNWAGLPWGKYSWGVSCRYEGNRGNSDTIWSAILDKDMTTSFDLAMTTNVGLIPVGASVLLASHDPQGHAYYAALDENGQLLLPDVYRDDYFLSVHLAGFEDYVSSDVIPVFAPTHYEAELVEKLSEITDLYVSSTGWAIWQVSDSQIRDIQRFDIRLDGQMVGSIAESFYQLDVSALEPNRQYVVQVRPVYLSSTGAWHTYNWIYRSCSDYPGTVNGLQWTLLEDAVLLSWQYPGNVDVEGAMLYRDGEFIGMTEENAFLDEEVVMHGFAEYGIRIVYGGPHDGAYYSMSCKEQTTASFPVYCDPPVKLDAENFLDENGDYGALISWGDRPPVVQEWLHYDNGVFKNMIGNDEEPILFWAIRFDAELLSDYQGTELKKIAIYDVCAGTYQLWIYVGGDTSPQTLARYQNMHLVGSHAWYEQEFDPMEIPENVPIWIVVGQQGLDRPAAACADTGDPDGRWVSMDGKTWRDMNYYNVHYTWMLRAFVSNQKGKQISLGKEDLTLQNFNLYRSYNNVDYQKIASIPNVEGQAFYQYKDVLVGTSHHEFYYRLTAEYLSDEGETCESDFAASLNHPENNFVWVDDHWNLTENQEIKLVVYPNPAADLLHIEAKDICRLDVFNVLGQCVISEKVAKDETQLDFSDLPNGLYLLKVETKNGVASRRFVVAH